MITNSRSIVLHELFLLHWLYTSNVSQDDTCHG